jgi:hypothetical protein
MFAMSNAKLVRIAMWSGPRNISTAMMRSWGNRPDTFVCDEPFYAHYLHATGRDHPGADEVIASGETDWRKVVARSIGTVRWQRRPRSGSLRRENRSRFRSVCVKFMIAPVNVTIASMNTAFIEDFTQRPQRITKFLLRCAFVSFV